MTISNMSKMPPIWDDAALANHAQAALEAFVERRLAEPVTRYIEHLKARKQALRRLVRLLSTIDAKNPDISIVRKILLDRELISALRYIAGPPISADDLGVLVTRGTARVSKNEIKSDPKLANQILALICQLADSQRFPWIQAGRRPRIHELKQAIRATASMHAAQTVQTERRGYGKEVEGYLRKRLEDMGFEKKPTPNKGKITAPNHLPQPNSFYGECSVHGRRADLLIGLPDGRCVAVEAKDSSSVVNSVKRVLNDTAAKARHWHGKFGETIIPVALLSGVFGFDNLKAAQESGLYLVWSHDLKSFTFWLSAQ
jgi:hypothetical protein